MLFLLFDCFLKIIISIIITIISINNNIIIIIIIIINFVLHFLDFKWEQLSAKVHFRKVTLKTTDLNFI